MLHVKSCQAVQTQGPSANPGNHNGKKATFFQGTHYTVIKNINFVNITLYNAYQIIR